MSELINSLVTPFYGKYYINQVLTILLLFSAGLLIQIIMGCGVNKEEKTRLKNAILFGFPTGLSLFVLVGVSCLVLGIPYKTQIVTGIIIAIILVLGLIKLRNRKISLNKGDGLAIIGGLIACVIIGTIAVSGKTAMSISNDSLYYFWEYPKAIVYYGGLRDQFDNFLTDTGLGASVIGTLPFLYGFGETFGIQEFFHINFALIFGNEIYEEIKRSYNGIDNKKACVISAASVILLAVCTPVYILSHWAMSNMYFMEFSFISLLLARKIAAKDEDNLYVPLILSLFTCSFLRMEGAMFVILLAIIISFMEVDNKKIACLLAYVAIIFTILDVKIFIVYTMDNPYTFMTKGKALIQLVAFVAVIIYLCVIKNKIPSVIAQKLPILLILGLILANIVLCIYDSEIYIGNLKAFWGNLFGQSGWGMLPYLTIGSIVIILYWELFVNSKKRVLAAKLSKTRENALSFWVCATLVFFLTSLAVSFARGDVLDVKTGDSGNRVLLQITPFVLMSFILWFVDLLNRDEAGK